MKTIAKYTFFRMHRGFCASASRSVAAVAAPCVRADRKNAWITGRRVPGGGQICCKKVPLFRIEPVYMALEAPFADTAESD